MIPDTYAELVSKLYQKTVKGEINWIPTAKKDSFLISIKDFSLSIAEGYDTNVQEKYAFIEIYDSRGKAIDSFYVGVDEEIWDKVDAIWSGARRKALKIDEAVKLISAELDAEGEVGEDVLPEVPPPDDIPF